MIDYSKILTGKPIDVKPSLNRALGQYKVNYTKIKVGITGREPEARFREHIRDDPKWKRMVVLYQTKSNSNANHLEDYLVEKHWDDLVNKKPGGGSTLSEAGNHYVYVLLR